MDREALKPTLTQKARLLQRAHGCAVVYLARGLHTVDARASARFQLRHPRPEAGEASCRLSGATTG